MVWNGTLLFSDAYEKKSVIAFNAALLAMYDVQSEGMGGNALTSPMEPRVEDAFMMRESDDVSLSSGRNSDIASTTVSSVSSMALYAVR